MMQRISIRTEINSSKENVFQNYTSADHIVNWNFASEEWFCPQASIDLRVGGKLNYRMEAKDGSMGFDFEGTITFVQENEKLEYEMDDGRPVSVNFSFEKGLTIVQLDFTPEQTNPEEMQRLGWLSILNNFKNYVEANS